MKNIYPIRLDNLSLTNLPNVLPVLVEGFNACEIEYYLIGALTRDLYMTGLHGYNAPRRTKDIDFAVLIQDIDDYNRLMGHFINTRKFQQTDEPYRLRFSDGTLIDLLPFGTIETDDRTVRIGDRNVVELTVIGLKENFEFTVTLKLNDSLEINVTSLSAMCLLKFLSWYDRPTERESDIKDIVFILDHYADIYQDEIFDEFIDWLESG